MRRGPGNDDHRGRAAHPGPVLLRRRGLLYVPPPAGAPTVPDPLVAAGVTLLEADLLEYGVLLSAALRHRLEHTDPATLAVTGQRLLAEVQAALGADRRMEPLFRGFPDSVPADTLALWVDRMLTLLAQEPDQPCVLCGRSGSVQPSPRAPTWSAGPASTAPTTPPARSATGHWTPTIPSCSPARRRRGRVSAPCRGAPASSVPAMTSWPTPTPTWPRCSPGRRRCRRRTATTCSFRLDRTHIDGDLFVFTGPTPDVPRGGALGLMENGTGVVTLYGLLGERPPMDLDGFREFARRLARPDTYEIIKDLEPVGEAATFRFPASTRRRYERLREFPAGLLVLGDALCSVNPAYGQGMAMCALQAGILARLAATDPAVDPRRFFRAAARAVDAPWQIASGTDLTYPQVEGRRPFGMGVLNRYAQRLQAAAVRDAALTLAFGRVVNLLAPPPSLLRPDRALRVLVHGR